MLTTSPRRRHAALKLAATVTAFVFTGHEISSLTLTDQQDGTCHGTFTPIATSRRPVYRVQDERVWFVRRKASFERAGYIAVYVAAWILDAHDERLQAESGLDSAERAVAEQIASTYRDRIKALACELEERGSVARERVLDFLSPLTKLEDDV